MTLDHPMTLDHQTTLARLTILARQMIQDHHHFWAALLSHVPG
jgi:hypothetical protein